MFEYNKIMAIKITREKTNLGLREAKELVEAIEVYLQMNRTRLEDRLNSISQQIDGFDTYLCKVESAKKLLALCEEKEQLSRYLQGY